jgi:hypothetical protein
MKDIIDNPMQEYARIAKYLKNPAIKIDKLAQYAQGANPKVPEFLALAEIKSRQSMVAPSGAAGPVQTVQEDLVGSVTPQPQPMAPQQMAGLQTMQRPQGVAALPSGMNAQSLAGGGIVAFDDGGYVNEEMQYGGGGIVAFNGAKQSDVEEDEQTRRDREGASGILKDLKTYGKALGRDTLTLPGRALGGAYNTLNRGVRSLGMDTPYIPESYFGGDSSSMSPHLDATRRQNAAAVANKIASSGDADAQVGGFYGGKKPTDAQFAMVNPNAVNPGGPGPSPTGDKETSGRKASDIAKELGIKQVDTKEDMFGKYEKMFNQQASDAKAARQQDKWMRLLEAGLGIMGGTSQHALTNIGQGSMAAAKGYAQDKADYRKEDRQNVMDLMGLGMKKEEAIRENEKLAIARKEAEDKGQYYGAYGEFLKSKGATAGAGTGTKLQIAQERNAVAIYNKWMGANPMATPEEQNAAWLRSQQMAGAGSGGVEGPATVQFSSLGAPKKS